MAISVRPSMPVVRAAARPAVKADSAAIARPAAAPKPVATTQVEGGAKLGGQIVGGVAGGVAGAMGGSAVGLLAYLFMGAAGNPFSGVITLCALGFGALGVWTGVMRGGEIGAWLGDLFKK